jgi:preprotein translocase subunit YajC
MGKFIILIIFLTALFILVSDLYKKFKKTQNLQSDLEKGEQAKETITNLYNKIKPTQKSDEPKTDH